MLVLLTGANGILGRAIQGEFPACGLSLLALTRADLDISDHRSAAATIRQARPDVVVNCAAYTHVDAAETNEAEAMRINATAAHRLAEICAEQGIRIVYPSTDYVFAGDIARAYGATDEARPINAYGRSKLAGELATQTVPDHLIIRTSWLFGAGGPNFVRTVITRTEIGERMRVVDDQSGRPTSARDLARAIAQMLLGNVPSGVYHVANGGVATWFTFAAEIARLIGRSEAIVPCDTSAFPRPAPRPRFSVLDTSVTDELIGVLRPWPEALTEAVYSRDY